MIIGELFIGIMRLIGVIRIPDNFKRRNMMKKRLLITLLILALAFGLVSCASRTATSYDTSTAYMGTTDEVAMAPEPAAMDAGGVYTEADSSKAAYVDTSTNNGITSTTDAEAVTLTSDRKLIYTANYTIESTDFDADSEMILSALSSAGGYAESSWVNGTKPAEYGDPGRYSEMTLRIPIASYSKFINALEGVGNILSKSQNTNDVTSQYTDVETRIRVLNTQLDSLEELKAGATNTTDLITIQQEITNVIFQLESYEGQKQLLDNQIDYTTVTIALTEVNEITTVTEGERGLGQKISDGFKNVGDAMVRFLEGLIVFIVGGAPAWVPIGLITWLIVWLVKRHNKKKQNTK
jgi:hypothetical protein